MTTAPSTALFAAGCFWGIEAAFRALPGVIDVESGYSGGTKENPTYEEVCSGTTGHAETVRVTYDPARISFKALVEAFWKMHDPTQVGRQGPDIGTQYRSAIFASSSEEAATARASKAELEGQLGKSVATEIIPAGPFYRAEEYHQRYLEKTGSTTCAA